MLDRILELMKKQNINKNQLAKLSNIPRTTIYSALSSEENCQKSKLDTMRPIAKVLNTTLDYIITGREPKEEDYLPNTIITIGKDGKKTTYQIDDEDAPLVISLLKKLKSEQKQ